MSAPANEITLVGVNFNSGSGLAKMVGRLAKHVTASVIVDNASSDGSADPSKLPEHCHLITNQQNLGYGRAVNQAMGAVQTSMALICNPDCDLHPDALATLAGALQADGAALLAGPLVLDRFGNRQRGTWRRLPTRRRLLLEVTGLAKLERFSSRFAGIERRDQGLPSAITEVEALSGACLLVATDKFRTLAGFDPGFFLHFEDLDLFARAREQHWHCLLVPQAIALHTGGGSSKATDAVARGKRDGLIRYANKHFRGGVLSRVLVRAIAWMRFMWHKVAT